MPRIALYPGSFDPITNGHLDVVRHAVTLCDRLIVAIGVHSGKKPLFSTEERLEMVRATCEPIAQAAGCDVSLQIAGPGSPGYEPAGAAVGRIPEVPVGSPRRRAASYEKSVG